MWNKAKPAANANTYLHTKGVKAYGVRQLGDTILVPLVDTSGCIHGIQFIQPGGVKKFKTGTKKLGHYFPMGKPTHNVLLICEGYATGASLLEATGYPVAVAFDAGNLQPVAENLRKKYPEMKLIICADNNVSGIGQSRANMAANAVSGLVAVPPITDSDFNDLHRTQGTEAVKACVEAAIVADDRQRCGTVADQYVAHCPENKGCGGVADLPPSMDGCSSGGDDYNLTISRLASLSPIEYECQRKDEAARLGIRVSSLDLAVKKITSTAGADTGLPFAEITPWPEPVNPSDLLNELAAVVRRFIICDSDIPVVVALWAVMTWLMDVVDVAPLFVITAPEKRCGKSLLLSLLNRLVYRPLQASNISPASVFRSIDAWHPTLLIDEVDAFMKTNEELRGLINSGHTRDSAYVIRTVGDNFIPTRFSTWGAKALSGIGYVADTLMDRAVVIKLRRKLSHEQVDRLRNADSGLFDTLTAKIARFVEDYRALVREAKPDLPRSLNDRAQDNWEPLLAIASVAGPDWLALTTKVAVQISGGEDKVKSLGVELLTDIQELFEVETTDRVSTAELIRSLIADEEKPWATYNRGQPIRPRQISRMLKEFNIISKSIRIGPSTPKGYEKKQFEDAFARYLSSPDTQSATTPQPRPAGEMSVAETKSSVDEIPGNNQTNMPEQLSFLSVADNQAPLSATTRIKVTV
jgi:putative DNA primase/helicase